jgi:hypothetical protein
MLDILNWPGVTQAKYNSELLPFDSNIVIPN